MAGGAFLKNAVEDGITVAIHRDFANLLRVAAGLAFEPKTTPYGGKVVGVPGPHRLFDSLLVGVGHHQDFLRADVLHHYRHQAVLSEFDFQHR